MNQALKASRGLFKKIQFYVDVSGETQKTGGDDGRTGGSSMDLDIDNIDLTTSQIPEPSGALLAGLGLLALGARRKR